MSSSKLSSEESKEPMCSVTMRRSPLASSMGFEQLFATFDWIRFDLFEVQLPSRVTWKRYGPRR